MLTLETLKIGGRYNWKNQPERLIYMGMCEPRNGRWHQFMKVDEPDIVWCEVLTADLHMLEATVGVPVVDKPGMTPEQWDSEVARLTAIKDDPRKEYGRRCEASTVLVRLLTAGRPSGVQEVPRG